MTRTFERIAADIVTDIKSGKLNPGDRIASIVATKARYDCGYYTVRQARLLLKRRGYVENAGQTSVIVTGYAPFL